MGIREQRDLLNRHEISVKELTECYLNRIETYDPALQSYITVTKEQAYQDAEAAQKKIDDGTAAPLCGIPLAIKDNICTDGVRTTCASKMLEDFIPPYNATVMEKLNAQNAVMLGKTSMDEFAMGGSTQTSAFAKTKNPFGKDCVPVLLVALLHVYPLPLQPLHWVRIQVVRFVSRLHSAALPD